MIKIILGNVGSGKTAGVVREMLENQDKIYYTNIDIYGRNTKHIKKILPEHIIKKELVKVQKNGEEIFKLSFNKEFWIKQIEKEQMLNVVIDEAHIFFNPRRSMSKLNIIMSDFLSLLRRVVGGVGGEKGELILITQLSRRLDIIAKEMATNVVYCVNHQIKKCNRCKNILKQNNEQPESLFKCKCGGRYKVIKNIVEQWKFKNMDLFEYFFYNRQKTFYTHLLINDIEKSFNHYNTLQWDDFFSNY
jgi:hypothetical protein